MAAIKSCTVKVLLLNHYYSKCHGSIYSTSRLLSTTLLLRNSDFIFSG